MQDFIEHEGVVVRIEGGHVFVRIEQQSACAMCHAKSMCSTSDMAEKVVEASMLPDEPCAVGDRVAVVGRKSVGFKAVFLAFILPLCLMFATLYVAQLFTTNDAISGTVALGILLPYSLMLLAFKKRLSAKFSFVAKHIASN